MRPSQNLIGQKYGRLTVIHELLEAKLNGRQWLCICDCGNDTILTTGNLKNQKICGEGCNLRMQQITGFKRCSECSENLSVKCYPKNRSAKDGLSPLCRPCNNAKTKLWRAENPDVARSSDLKKKYGITLEDKRKIFAKQGSRCAACGSLDSKAKYPGEHGWPLDHNHVTGKIRGILCQPCNTTLGYSEESIERLQSLINYLRRHSN